MCFVARYTQAVRVMGIDPGFHRCGYAVVERGEDRKEILLASGVIVTRRKDPLAVRLHALAEEYRQLLDHWQPDTVAVEELFFAKNVKTAVGVAQARGVILERAAAVSCAVAEYAPSVVKSQLTGNGQADKQQVEYMVRKWFPELQQARLDDELDAIGVALCHCQRAGIPEVLK